MTHHYRCRHCKTSATLTLPAEADALTIVWAIRDDHEDRRGQVCRFDVRQIEVEKKP